MLVRQENVLVDEKDVSYDAESRTLRFSQSDVVPGVGRVTTVGQFHLTEGVEDQIYEAISQKRSSELARLKHKRAELRAESHEVRHRIAELEGRVPPDVKSSQTLTDSEPAVPPRVEEIQREVLQHAIDKTQVEQDEPWPWNEAAEEEVRRAPQNPIREGFIDSLRRHAAAGEADAAQRRQIREAQYRQQQAYQSSFIEPYHAGGLLNAIAAAKGREPGGLPDAVLSIPAGLRRGG